MAWYLAPCLAQLRAETNARWPGRDKTSDGSIGDASHAARLSDHNPARPPSPPVVRATDTDVTGIDPLLFVRVACADYRTNYVIFNRVIYTRANGFRPAYYGGTNPHTGHVHVSIRHGATYENDRRPWFTTQTVSNATQGPGTVPTVPDLTSPDPLEETFMAALTDQQQLDLYNAIMTPGTPNPSQARIALQTILDRTAAIASKLDAQTNGIEHAGAIATEARNLTAHVITLLGSDLVDEEALAAALAPLLPKAVTSVSDADLDRLSAAVIDEQDRRARERLA